MRSVRHAGLPISVATRSVSGGNRWSPGFFALRGLLDIASSLRTEPEELLWSHTMLPYATAFFDQALLERAIRAALSRGDGATGMGVVTQSVSDHSRLRRLCPLCSQEELERWGESYWHRAHNLPGVIVCLRHGTSLAITDIPTVSRRWHGILPHEVVADTVGPRPTKFAELLARASIASLDRPQTVLQCRDAAWYRRRLVAKGLVSSSRAIDSASLANWVSAWLGESPASFGLRKPDESLRWLALMVRPGNDAPFVPLKHFIFEAALEAQAHQASPLLDFIPQGFLGCDKKESDTLFAANARQVIRRHIELGERVRVRDVLTEVGCWGQYRHDRTSYPRVAAAIRWLKRSSSCMRPHWGKGANTR